MNEGQRYKNSIVKLIGVIFLFVYSKAKANSALLKNRLIFVTFQST